MADNILLWHLKNNLEALKLISEAAGIADHSGNKGSIREGLITNFLAQNMPEFVRYHTGEIFDCVGERSGQIDIVLHPITSPKLHLLGSINLFPTETVLSAIEVKSNLDTKELKIALLACEKVKKLHRFDQKVSNTKHGIIDVSKVPYILFCYKGLTLNNLYKNINKIMNKNNISHNNLPDLILVLDKGFCLEKPINAADVRPLEEYYRNTSSDQNKVLLGIFIYLMKLIEDWASNSSQYTMPIAYYEKVWRRETGFLDVYI
jgi:hypothetical protein